VKWAALVFVVFVAAACSSGSDTQFVPIGSRCSKPSDCGTAPYDCAIAGYPYGYCEKPCMLDGECPADSLCDIVEGECRRVCTADADCRVNDGYSCQPLETKAVCDIVATTMDVGQP
jgi:hypothetical protein